MAQQNHLGKTATTITNDGKYTVITYHNTDVVRFNDRVIILDSGGWKTQTTKTRMNQASNQFGLGYYVSQKDFYWFVLFKDKEVEFKDGIKLSR